MRVKLSPAQTRVIERMRAGEILNHIDGIRPMTWFKNEPSINTSTIFKLMAEGLIVHDGGCWELTEKGRTVIILK